jgi:oligopeptide transport system substrate-binding protein
MRRAAAVIVFMVLVACAPDADRLPTVQSPGITVTDTPSQALTSTDTFRYAIGEPSAIVPPAVIDPSGLAVVDALFDSLTAYDHTLQVVPAAAESWESAQPDRWTFTLRTGATFHDGSPVTAADFKYAWELAVRLNLAGYHLRDVKGYAALRSGKTSELSGVTAIDDRTLQVTLSGPRADFPTLVAHPALGPILRTAWRADEVAYRERPMGNGPFRMDGTWEHGQFIRLARFGAWADGALASVDEVLFRIADPDTAYLAFQQGRFDFAPVPAGALAEARRDFPPSSKEDRRGPGLLLDPIPSLYFLGFNVTRPPFDDVQVRRAVSMAIDREALQAQTLEGNVSIARAVVPPPIPGARASACSACQHNPTEARQIFAERGITTLELWLNRGGGHELVADRIRQDLAEAGVELVLRSEPPPPGEPGGDSQLPKGTFDAYLDMISSGEAGLFRFGWTTEYPTMDAALWPLFHSAATPEAGGQNYMRYADPEVDALLSLARATTYGPVRQALYQQAEDLALERDQVIVPLFTYHHRAVAAKRIDNLYVSPFGLVNLSEIRFAPTR